MVFNTTFNNISAISWRFIDQPILFVLYSEAWQLNSV